MSSTLAPRMSAPRGTRRLSAILTSALMVALGASLSMAPAAQAAPQTISSSSLHWGIKSSFRSYISTFGTITASDGATKDTSSASSPYTWSGAGGSYDPVTKVGHLDFAGKVVFSAPAHTIWNITIANPSIVFDGSSTGKIVADVAYSTGGTEANPATSGSDADVDFATFSVAAPTLSGSTYTFTEPAPALTEDGATGFGGFYTAGTALDAFTAEASPQPPAPVVTITTGTLPHGLAGKSYKATLAAAGGKKSYKWSVASGALPTGLKLSTSGRFSGTAAHAESASFTVQVKDNTRPTANVTTKAFTLVVDPMTVTTTSLPAAVAGKTYRGKLTAAGGKPGLKWSVAAGALPPGLQLSTSGSLSRKATAAGTYMVTFKVTDNTKPAANTATKTLSIVVN